MNIICISILLTVRYFLISTRESEGALKRKVNLVYDTTGRFKVQQNIKTLLFFDHIHGI